MPNPYPLTMSKTSNTMACPSRHAPSDRENHQGSPELTVEAGLGAIPAAVTIKQARHEEPQPLEAGVVDLRERMG